MSDGAGIRLQLDVSCMWEAHGPLDGYQTANGGICVAPCSKCLEKSRALGESQAAEAWKTKVREAIDG